MHAQVERRRSDGVDHQVVEDGDRAADGGQVELAERIAIELEPQPAAVVLAHEQTLLRVVDRQHRDELGGGGEVDIGQRLLEAGRAERRVPRLVRRAARHGQRQVGIGRVAAGDLRRRAVTRRIDERPDRIQSAGVEVVGDVLAQRRNAEAQERQTEDQVAQQPVAAGSVVILYHVAPVPSTRPGHHAGAARKRRRERPCRNGPRTSRPCGAPPNTAAVVVS